METLSPWECVALKMAEYGKASELLHASVVLEMRQNTFVPEKTGF
jgi:hypothetical protein